MDSICRNRYQKHIHKSKARATRNWKDYAEWYAVIGGTLVLLIMERITYYWPPT